MKKRNLERSKNSNNVCFKCGKQYHFIIYCPIHKDEHKKCINFEGHKNKSRNQLRDKSSKGEIVDHVAKEALAILGNSLSDSEGQNILKIHPY